MSSRRRFLTASAAAITVAALPKSLLAALPSSEAFTSATIGAYQQGILTQAAFQKVLNTLFMAMLGDNKVSYMTLISATVTSQPTVARSLARSTSTTVKIQPNASSQVESFQAVFQTDGTAFSQGSYILDHGTLGRFVCFLVSSVPGSQSVPTCTATFSYLVGSSPSQPIAPVVTPVSAPASTPVSAPVAGPVARPIVMPVTAPVASPVATPLATPIVRPLSGIGSPLQSADSPGGLLTNN